MVQRRRLRVVKTGLEASRKQLLKVELLTLIRNVNDTIGFLFVYTVV